MTTQLRNNQGGVMLLEAMIGILIFSLGVLALVAMQAVSISNVSNAQYRSEAAFLANEIISQAWVDRGPAGVNIPTYRWPGGNSRVAAWVVKVNALLPQSNIYPPTITVNPILGINAGREMIVTIQWKAPDALTPSNHVAIGYVSEAADP